MMAAQQAAQQQWWTPQGPGSVTGGGSGGSVAGGFYASVGVAPLTPQRALSTSDQQLAQLGSGTLQSHMGGAGGPPSEFFVLPSIAGSEPPTPNQQQQQQLQPPLTNTLASPSPPAPNTSSSQSLSGYGASNSNNLYLAPNGVPLALEGASASMRLFPSNTISTPSMPLSSYMQFQHQHAIQQQQHTQHAQQQMRYAQQQQQQQAQQMKTDDSLDAARRKRQRADETGASWDTMEHSNNLQPPALFNLAAAASSNEITQQQQQPPPQTRNRAPIFSVQPNGTVNVNQDRIQRAIDGLHASLRVHNASVGAHAPPPPILPPIPAVFGASATSLSSAAGAATPTPVRGNDSTGSDADSDAGAGVSPTTPAAAPATRGRGAKSKAVGGARTKAAAATKGGKGSKRASSPHHEPEADLSDGTRKSKHRAIEKQRRDELKKNMEILSAMVGYAQTTNKNGVVLASIAFINNLQANLDAETARNRNLSAELAGVDKRIAELQASHSAALASVAHNTLAANSPSHAHSQALVASSPAMSAHAIQNGTVGFQQYRLLFSQYQEAQSNFRELADWMRSLCQDGSNALLNSLSTMVLSGGEGIECPDDQQRKEFGQYVQRSLRKLIGPDAGSVPASPNANANNGGGGGRDSPFGGFSGGVHTDESVVGAGMLYPNTPGSFTENGLGESALAGAGGVTGVDNGSGSGSSATMVEQDSKSMLFRTSNKSASQSPAAVAALSATLRRAMQNASSIDYRSLWLSPGCARMLCRDRIIIDANSVFLEDLGYTHAELIGQNVTEITPTIKQPMMNLVVSCSGHGAVSKTFLNCYRSKKGSIVFRFGQVDVVWAKSVCEPNAAYKASMIAEQQALAARQTAARENPVSPQDLHSVSTNSSSSGDAIALNTLQPHQVHACDEPSMTTTPGGCRTSEQRCPECGATPIYVQSIGLPTSYTDVPGYLLTSQLTALQMIDPAITGHGLNVSELYSAGKVSYEAQQVNSNGSGFVTVKVTKQLPMKFVQAVQIYDQLARTAAATKTSPPCIRL